jgi:hypothetical protein
VLTSPITSPRIANFIQAVSEEEVQVQVCLFGFDLLYLNDKSYLNEPFSLRREVLRNAFKQVSVSAVRFCSSFPVTKHFPCWLLTRSRASIPFSCCSVGVLFRGCRCHPGWPVITVSLLCALLQVTGQFHFASYKDT